MKTCNRKTTSFTRRATALATGLLVASGLVVGSAAAESRPTLVPHRGALFSDVQSKAPQMEDLTRTEQLDGLARTDDPGVPGRVDSRTDDQHTAPRQPREHPADALRLRPPFGLQGPWYR